MFRKYNFRGFTEEGFLIETLKVTFLGIPIFFHQCVDSLVTEKAAEEIKAGIGFDEEINNLENNDK